MISSKVRQTGLWSGIFLVALGLAYIGLIVAMMISGSGFPPSDSFQTMINIVVLLTAVGMVILWSALHKAAPVERNLFSQISLSLIEIFAALTSINRYVGLTVVRQSLATGNLNGLQWFLPYGWPSIMLAIEFLAWGFFFGLACLCLAPVFTKGKLERAIFWTLVVTGILSLIAALGQVIGSNSLSFSPYTFSGVIAWGPGLTAIAILMVAWFHRADDTSGNYLPG